MQLNVEEWLQRKEETHIMQVNVEVHLDKIVAPLAADGTPEDEHAASPAAAATAGASAQTAGAAPTTATTATAGAAVGEIDGINIEALLSPQESLFGNMSWDIPELRSTDSSPFKPPPKCASLSEAIVDGAIQEANSKMYQAMRHNESINGELW